MRRNTNHTLNRVHPFSTIMNYYVSNKFRNSKEAYFLKQKTGKGIGNGGGGLQNGESKPHQQGESFDSQLAELLRFITCIVSPHHTVMLSERYRSSDS